MRCADIRNVRATIWTYLLWGVSSHNMSAMAWREHLSCFVTNALRACFMSNLRRKDVPSSHKICIKSRFCYGRGTTNLTPQIGLDRKSFGCVEDMYLINFLCSPALVSRIRACCTPNLHPSQTQSSYRKSWNGRKVLHKRSLLTLLSEICSERDRNAGLLVDQRNYRTKNTQPERLLALLLALHPLPWTSRCHMKSIAIENHRVISLAVQLPQDWELLQFHIAVQVIFTCKLSLRSCHTRSSYHAWQHIVCSWPDDVSRCAGSLAVTCANVIKWLKSAGTSQVPTSLWHS